jgi:hypothetical protein
LCNELKKYPHHHQNSQEKNEKLTLKSGDSGKLAELLVGIQKKIFSTTIAIRG